MTYHGFDFPDLPFGAFEHVGDRRIKPHGFFRSLKQAFRDITDPILQPVADIINGGVEVIGGAVEAVGSTVGKALENTIESAIHDPIGTAVMVTTALVAPQLLPVVSAAKTAVEGGSLEDIAKSAAISYAAGQAGAGAAEATGSGLAGAGAAGATSAALRGQDPITGGLSGAINYGFNTGLDQAINAPSYSGGLPSDYVSPETATPINFEGQTYTEALPTDYSLKADYSFAPQQFTGLQAGDVQIPTDLELDVPAPPIDNLGLKFNEAPNLKTMGGGQGLVADVPGGVVSSAGFIPSDASPNLGDPNSFINNPDVLGQPVAPVETTSNIPLPKLNVAGALLGAGAAGTQTPATTTAPAMGGLSAGIPWLESSPDVLQGKSVQTTDPLAGIDPELAAILRQRLSGQQPSHQPTTLMASGGSTSCQTLDEKLMPKFGPSEPDFLQTVASAKRTPLSLKPIRHLQQNISPLGNMGALAAGGLPKKYQEAAPKGHRPEFVTGLTGYYADGRGTGQSDDIPAMLHDGDYVMDAETVSALGDGSSKAGRQVLDGFRQQVPHSAKSGGSVVPAKIADGEYVFPESFVTALGQGDNKRGASILDGLREKLREHKRSAPLNKIPPKAKSPLDYIEKAKG